MGYRPRWEQQSRNRAMSLTCTRTGTHSSASPTPEGRRWGARPAMC